jgi:hypothetical protein
MRYIQPYRELNQLDVFESKIIKFSDRQKLDEQVWDTITGAAAKAWDKTKEIGRVIRDSPITNVAGKTLSYPASLVFGYKPFESFLEDEDYHDYFSYASTIASFVNVPVFPGMAVSTTMDIVHALAYCYMAWGTKRDGSKFYKTEEQRQSFISGFLIEACCALLPPALKVMAREYKIAVRLGKVTPKFAKIEAWIYRNFKRVIQKVKEILPGCDPFMSEQTIRTLQDKMDEVEGLVDIYMSRQRKKAGKKLNIKPDSKTPSKVTAEFTDGGVKAAKGSKETAKKQLIKKAKEEQKALLSGKKVVGAEVVSPEVRSLLKGAADRIADYKFMKAIWEANPGVCKAILEKMGFKTDGDVSFVVMNNVKNTWEHLSGKIVKFDSVLADTDEVYDLVNLTTKPAKDALAQIGQGMVEMVIGGKTVKVSYPDFLEHVLQMAEKALGPKGEFFRKTPKVLLRLIYFDYFGLFSGGADASGGAGAGTDETKPTPQETQPTPQETQPKPQETTPTPQEGEKGKTLPETDPKVYEDANKENQTNIKEQLPEYDPKKYNSESASKTQNFVKDLSERTKKDIDDVQQIIADLGGIDGFEKSATRLSNDTGKSIEECQDALLKNEGRYEGAKNSLKSSSGKKIIKFSEKENNPNPESQSGVEFNETSLKGRDDKYKAAVKKLMREFPNRKQQDIVVALDKSAQRSKGNIDKDIAREILKSPDFQPKKKENTSSTDVVENP